MECEVLQERFHCPMADFIVYANQPFSDSQSASSAGSGGISLLDFLSESGVCEQDALNGAHRSESRVATLIQDRTVILHFLDGNGCRACDECLREFAVINQRENVRRRTHEFEGLRRRFLDIRCRVSPSHVCPAIAAAPCVCEGFPESRVFMATCLSLTTDNRGSPKRLGI
jgi:hypothetical protein